MNAGKLTFAAMVTLSTLFTGAAIAQEASSQRFDVRMADILRPFVVPLDRDLWTFRYEGQDSFSPASVADLGPRIGNWANRFWDPQIISGADTGPGVYVASDPAATSTWGGTSPRLYAIRIKKGTRILIGDQDRVEQRTLDLLDRLAKDMKCGSSSTQMDYGLGHAVGFFRMNESVPCRQAVVQALRSLGVQALSYGFNSAPLKDCRITGTAISIISSSAVSLGEINRYSEDGNIEGQPSVTPFVQRLFDEAKGDYYTQSLLANLETRERYKEGYGFFSRTQATNLEPYTNWKNRSILKCGPKWSIEAESPRLVHLSSERMKSHPEAKELLIKMALVYRAKFQNALDVPSETPRELNIHQVRKVKSRVKPSFENTVRFYSAQIPLMSGNSQRDTAEYLEILSECLKVYENDSVHEIIRGQCAVEPE